MEHEAIWRLSFFMAVLLLMAGWEWKAPRRPRSVPNWWRRASNVSLAAINVLAIRLVAPLTLVGWALFATSRQWGLLHLVDWPTWLEVTIAVVLLDLAVYLQHVMLHAVPTLWRLHMVHHADRDLDVTSGLRFHTFEILLSLLIKMGVVVVLGPPPVAVVIFEIALNATAMFNHSNAYLPVQLDRWLRLLLVTPDMHRVHHSVVKDETNSNFGFNLPWWDFLFGTYRRDPRAGQLGMTLGLKEFQDHRQTDQLPGMLMLPFVRHRPDAMLQDAQGPPSNDDTAV